MKKLIYFAVCTVSGFLFVSCSAETEGTESSTTNQKSTLFQKQNQGFTSRATDSIPDAENSAVKEGPGDVPIVIPPPKP